MIPRSIYLDANATEPLRPQARAAMLSALDVVGNPSSVHMQGRAARRILEDARESLAALFGTRPANIVFTSGGTEADVLAIQSLGLGRRILCGGTEHDAVRQAAPGETIPVRANGMIDPDRLSAMLTEGDAAHVSVMFANNETGTINPIPAIAAMCVSHGARLHVDAVQAAGRLRLHLAESGADSLAISSHKLGGPAGVGALLLADAASFGAPMIRGGGQEAGRRGGTQAVAVIAGFAAAALAAVAALDDMRRLASLRDRLEAVALAAGAEVFGAPDHRLPNTTCLRMPGLRADQQVIALDLENIAVSAGAACSSGKIGASHVLEQMGAREAAEQAIRVSLPWNVTEAHVDRFCAVYPKVMERLRLGPLVPAALGA
jgi:cysteine desulfurase